MTNPTPEERAEALRLAWDDIEAVIRGRLGTHEAVVAALDGVVFVKDTLLAVESERAELAREAEELRGALANASDALPDPMHPAFPRELVDGQADALAIIADALSKPTEGE